MNASASAAGLTGISGTSLATLTARAAGSVQLRRRKTRDAAAERVCRELGVDFNRCSASPSTVKGVTARSAWFDARCLWALRRLDDPQFVCLGSGLDTMYERVAARAGERRFDWIDADLPDVVRLREHLLPNGGRRRTLALDITAVDWLDAIDWVAPRPVVLLAEGVLMYLEQNALAALFRNIATRFSGNASIHFVFDWASPAMQRFSRRHPAVGKTVDRSIVFHSSLTRARDIARFDPRWHIVAQYDVMRKAGVGPALFSLAYRLSTTRRFMGCAHAILA